VVENGGLFEHLYLEDARSFKSKYELMEKYVCEGSLHGYSGLKILRYGRCSLLSASNISARRQGQIMRIHEAQYAREGPLERTLRKSVKNVVG